MKKLPILFTSIVLGVLLLISGCSKGTTGNGTTDVKGGAQTATIFKAPGCGCCSLYAQYLEQKGFAVTVKDSDDVLKVKKNYGIPMDMQSCHTVTVGNYFVEGHVPLEAIQKMMTEQPDIAGIAMPGMPSGSPGMPGSKQGDFVIYAVHKDGTTSEFMRM
ncbi:DUF411 domain-containing protein [Candidatus Woesearchaeota archaeon]|nr:DUF411 domain-containing protein [Candidatus Woesearchaeota archaeon]